MRGAWIEVPAPASGNACAASLPVRGAWIEIRGTRPVYTASESLPVRGAWIEIDADCRAAPRRDVSLPVRGAWIEIFIVVTILLLRQPSLPVRGAWIEIYSRTLHQPHPSSRSPCGERGLKSDDVYSSADFDRRSPHGERGLKYLMRLSASIGLPSLPVRGAWIEILPQPILARRPRPSLPVRGAWIEMSPHPSNRGRVQSLPVRGAWIEMMN